MNEVLVAVVGATIAVKVINYYGDEALKVYSIGLVPRPGFRQTGGDG